MSRTRGSLVLALLTAGVAAATTWASMLSWRGFAVDNSSYLRPLVVVAIVVAGTGALARWYRLPGVAVLALQLVAGVALVSWQLTGSPLPVGATYAELVDVFRDATRSANRYAPPVPRGVAPIDPLLIAGGLACLLLVDLLACTLRRVPLAGLPLLAIYSIPVSLLDGGLAWWVFALSAAGFLTLLHLHESEQVARWGRSLSHESSAGDPSSIGRAAGSIRRSAGTIGGVATALAVVVPVVIPTLDVHLFDFGPGSGGDDEITLENPMTDLRRDLKRDVDVPLLELTTDDPTPSYLRISVLNRFSDDQWTSGDRAIPNDQLPDGPMPALEGVDTTVPRQERDYQVEVYDSFESSWLPTQAPVSAITAEGDWRYDLATMDFIAGDDDLTTAGLRYDMTGVDLGLDADAMVAAPSGASQVDDEFLDLPDDLPEMVSDLATTVTEDATSPFEKAVALQNWFRRDGGFEYSLAVEPGNGTDDLVRFLEPETGRVGYCEQFASAFAVMARTLNIPARVAVGFLQPRLIGENTFEYSAFDLHAWPEIYVPGSGWVALEPTPPGRASGVPSYTRIDVGGSGEEIQPSESPEATPTAPTTRAPRETEAPVPEQDPNAGSDSSDEAGFPWLPVGGGLAGVLVLAAVALLPRSLRRSRRQQRLDGGPEIVWDELRDTALDLGLRWPDRRSPRETRDHLVRHLGPAADGTDPVASLDRIVRALEVARYARPGSSADRSLRPDGEACVAALTEGASRRDVRRAEWWPRSLFARGRTAPARSSRPTESVHGGVVDHV